MRRRKIATEVTIGAACARSLVKRLGVIDVPDLIEIARALRLKIKEEELEDCDGVLIRPVGISRGIIAVRKAIRSEGRKRFTVAHEIGHYVLPRHDEGGPICKSTDIEGWYKGANDRERQADDFAAELLIPASVVAARFASAPPSIEIIEAIADQCRTSLSASAWRFCDLCGEPCAVVWSTDRRVTWVKKSVDFPFFIPRDKPLPKNPMPSIASTMREFLVARSRCRLKLGSSLQISLMEPEFTRNHDPYPPTTAF